MISVVLGIYLIWYRLCWRRWVTLRSQSKWWRPVKTVRSIPWTGSTALCTAKYSLWTLPARSSRSGLRYSHLGKWWGRWQDSMVANWTKCVYWVFDWKEKLPWCRVAMLAQPRWKAPSVTRQRTARVNRDGEQKHVIISQRLFNQKMNSTSPKLTNFKLPLFSPSAA